MTCLLSALLSKSSEIVHQGRPFSFQPAQCLWLLDDIGEVFRMSIFNCLKVFAIEC
jgi:hypothetical protein